MRHRLYSKRKVNIGVDNSKMERYILQSVKSVVRMGNRESNTGWNMNGVQKPKVDKTMHVGICRSSNTDETTVLENIKKARRTMYSLMSSGLKRGLDPETSLHIYQIHVLHVTVLKGVGNQSIILLFHYQNICCWCPEEPSQ